MSVDSGQSVSGGEERGQHRVSVRLSSELYSIWVSLPKKKREAITNLIRSAIIAVSKSGEIPLDYEILARGLRDCREAYEYLSVKSRWFEEENKGLRERVGELEQRLRERDEGCREAMKSYEERIAALVTEVERLKQEVSNLRNRLATMNSDTVSKLVIWFCLHYSELRERFGDLPAGVERLCVM